MKKALSIILALAMALSLTACGSKEAGPAPPPPPPPPTASQGNTSSTQPETPSVDFPSRPIQIICPAKAGGDTDLYARLIAKYMEADLGVSVTVSNVVGGGGSIGSQQVYDSEADGHTLIFGVCTNVVLNDIMDLVDYDYNGFEMIGIPVTDQSNMLVASKEFAGKTLEDVISDLKANPGCYTFGTEVGSLGLLSGLALEKDAGVQFNLVDAGTMADRITAMLGGSIDFFFGPYASLKDYLATGEMVSMALFSSAEQATMPGVKTFESYGFEHCTFNKCFFMGAPKGTDQAVVDLLRTELESICNNADFAKDLEPYAIDPEYIDEAGTIEFFETTTEQFLLFEDALK